MATLTLKVNNIYTLNCNVTVKGIGLYLLTYHVSGADNDGLIADSKLAYSKNIDGIGKLETCIETVRFSTLHVVYYKTYLTKRTVLVKVS